MNYYLYEIRNNLNGRIYVGVHKTDDLNDGYMGSGKVITRAIAKYGIEHFTKVILEQFQDEPAMYAREKEIVTDEFLLREETYNLRRGGCGGFDYINKAGLSLKFDHINKAGLNGNKVKVEKGITNKGKKYRQAKKANHWMPGLLATKTQASTQKKIDAFAAGSHQQGTKNSQFGSMWITDGKASKKIKINDAVPEGWSKGRVLSKQWRLPGLAP